MDKNEYLWLLQTIRRAILLLNNEIEKKIEELKTETRRKAA